MGLTTKQRLFVEAYLGEARGNATEAARIAGYAGNDVTLGAVGAENLKKPQIAEAVGERIEENKVSTDYVLSGLKEISDNRNERTGDRIKAFELLGKYLSIWTENTKQDVSVRFGWLDDAKPE